ncbi:MAG: hypothetical protein ACM3U2_10570, partial [Deltaproteobacteria bacterium]
MLRLRGPEVYQSISRQPQERPVEMNCPKQPSESRFGCLRRAPSIFFFIHFGQRQGLWMRIA